MLNQNEQTRLDVLKSIPKQERNAFITKEIEVLEAKLNESLNQYDGKEVNPDEEECPCLNCLIGRQDFKSGEELRDFLFNHIVTHQEFTKSLDRSHMNRYFPFQIKNDFVIKAIQEWIETLPKGNLTEESLKDYINLVQNNECVIYLRMQRDLSTLLCMNIAESKSFWVQNAYFNYSLSQIIIQYANELHKKFNIAEGQIEPLLWEIVIEAISNFYNKFVDIALNKMAKKLGTTKEFKEGLMPRVEPELPPELPEGLNEILTKVAQQMFRKKS